MLSGFELYPRWVPLTLKQAGLLDHIVLFLRVCCLRRQSIKIKVEHLYTKIYEWISKIKLHFNYLITWILL